MHQLTTPRLISKTLQDVQLRGSTLSQHSTLNNFESNHDSEISLSRANLPPQRRWIKDLPFELIIENTTDVKTRSATQNEFLYSIFRSQEEPKKIENSLEDQDWVIVMENELNQFGRNKVWKLLPRPKDRAAIGIKWIFRNKLDELVVVTSNKAKLVVKGYSQEK